MEKKPRKVMLLGWAVCSLWILASGLSSGTSPFSFWQILGAIVTAMLFGGLALYGVILSLLVIAAPFAFTGGLIHQWWTSDDRWKQALSLAQGALLWMIVGWLTFGPWGEFTSRFLLDQSNEGLAEVIAGITWLLAIALPVGLLVWVIARMWFDPLWGWLLPYRDGVDARAIARARDVELKIEARSEELARLREERERQARRREPLWRRLGVVGRNVDDKLKLATLLVDESGRFQVVDGTEVPMAIQEVPGRVLLHSDLVELIQSGQIVTNRSRLLREDPPYLPAVLPAPADSAGIRR